MKYIFEVTMTAVAAFLIVLNINPSPEDTISTVTITVAAVACFRTIDFIVTDYLYDR